MYNWVYACILTHICINDGQFAPTNLEVGCPVEDDVTNSWVSVPGSSDRICDVMLPMMSTLHKSEDKVG